MGAENFVNFGTTLLATPNPLTSAGLSFTVTTGQGVLFPASFFLVTIESEVILISSRSGDTFTVASGGRGYDNTIATSHVVGVTVQMAACAFNFLHLWQNVADTFVPEVPPAQVGNSSSAFDNDFESAGGWTLYPSSGGSTTFNAGTSLKSHLLLNRVSPDNTMYTAYTSFVPGNTAWTATCKLSEGTNLLISNADQAQTSFFVSDQSNPTGGPDTGNRVKLNTVCGNTTTNGVLNTSSRLVRTIKDVSGSASFVGTQVPVSAGTPVWLRMNCDGAGTYQTYYSSDGITYWLLSFQSGLSFTVASIGVSFHVFNPSSQWVAHQAAVDYVRVVTGVAEPPYGS